MGLARRRFFELAAGAVLPTISGAAWALDYPTRPVRIIVVGGHRREIYD